MAIRRIVKMTFKPEKASDFETFFSEIKDQIEAQPGCHEVQLLKEHNQSAVFFTFSIWDDQSAIDAYRKTALFGKVWPKVKAWFDDKPEAWSTELIDKK